MIRSVFSLILSLLIALMPAASYAQALRLPEPGEMVSLTPSFTPSRIVGVNIDPHHPFNFSFIISHGDEAPRNESPLADAKQMIRYFFAAMTVPETELWVNLSPYEKNRVITDAFGKTEMGRDLLAQDYILKQLSASLMNPDEKVGKEFWAKVYAQAQERFGTTDIPFDTFNKIWIQPQDAVVYEHAKGALIARSHLKVLLEQDYLAAEENRAKQGVAADVAAQKQGDTSAVVRDVLIPAIEREVNEGRLFAKLRQIYSAVILAKWYKRSFQESLLGKVYVDRDKTSGVAHHEPQVNQAIYDRYVAAFKTGVCNFIKEEYDPSAGAVLPRKYFTGGANMQGPIQMYDPLSPIDRDGLKAVLGGASDAYDVVINPDGAQASTLLGTWQEFVETLKTNPALVSELYANPVFAKKVADWRNGIEETDDLKNFSEQIAAAVVANVDKVSMEKLLAAMEAIHPEGKSGNQFTGVVGPNDDGGYSFHIQDILRKAGYGVLAPPGDQVNLLQGLMDVIIQKHMMADHVRLAKDFKGDSFLKAILPFIQEAFENQEIAITPDFFVTLFAFMKAIANVDTLNRTLESRGVAPLSLAGASIRNIVHLGFQLEYGIVATHDKTPTQPAVSLASEQRRYATAMEALSILSGLGAARATVSSFEPRTMVAVYSGTTFLFRMNGDIKVLTVEKDQKGDLLLSSSDMGKTSRVTIAKWDSVSLNKIINISKQGTPNVEFKNSDGVLILKVGEASWRLEDDDLNDPRFVDPYSAREIKLAFDGTGRARDKQGVLDEAPLFALENGVELFVRPRVVKTQTAITESVSYLPILHMGFSNESSGLEGAIPSSFLKGRRPAANKFLLERIAKGAEKPGTILISGGTAMASLWKDVLKQLPGAGKERDLIIIGPGSFYTSILPHFMVEGLPEALRDAKARGAHIVFVLNATLDNETIGLTPLKMLQTIETYAGLKLDQIVTSLMVAEDMPEDQMSPNLKAAAHQAIAPEIRTNPAAASKSAKMPRGLLMSPVEDQQAIQKAWPSIKVELLKGPFNVVEKKGRDGSPELHLYYNQGSVTEGLSDLIILPIHVDLKDLVEQYRSHKTVSMLEWNKAFTLYAAMPRWKTIRVVVTAQHDGLNKPYAREFFIPRDLQDRDVLLNILAMKIVSLGTGVVGAAKLGIYVEGEDESIRNSLNGFFQREGKGVADYLRTTFGDFELRYIQEREIPALRWHLPINGVRAEKTTFRFEPQDVFLGIAIDGTGVEVSLLDHVGNVQQTQQTGWWRSEGGKQVAQEPGKFKSAREIVDVIIAAVESAWQKVPNGQAQVASVGVSVAAAVIKNTIMGNASFISGLSSEERKKILPLLEERLKQSKIVKYSTDGVVSALHDGVAVALHNIVARDKSPENNTVAHIFVTKTSLAGAVENQENHSVVPLELGKIVMQAGGALHDVLGIPGMSQQFGPTLKLFAQLMDQDTQVSTEWLTIFQQTSERYRVLSLLKATGGMNQDDTRELNNIEAVFTKMGDALAELVANIADDIGEKKFSVMLNGEILKSGAAVILIERAKEDLRKMGLNVELFLSSAHRESLAVSAGKSSMVKANNDMAQSAEAEKAVMDLLHRSETEENVPMYEWDELLRGFEAWPRTKTYRVVLMPQQKGFDKPYAYEAYIPKKLSAVVRQALVERLKEKAVSLVAGLMGAETLAIYSEDEAIYNDIWKYFQHGEPGEPVSTYVRNIFGKFDVERFENEDGLPKELFRIPQGISLDVGKDNKPDPRKVYLAFDLGRSDAKFSLITPTGVVSYKKKWTTGYDTGVIEEKNGREFTSSSEHIRFLTEVAKLLFAKAKQEGKLTDDYVVAGVGMSVNAAVYDGQIVGAVESFKGLTDEDRRKNIRPLLTRTIESMREYDINIMETPRTALWNDGNASAAADILSRKTAYRHSTVLHLSLGTGIAGAFEVYKTISLALTEMGKLVVDTSKDPLIPAHDQVKVQGVGQGLAGNQRNFVYIIKRLLSRLPEGQEFFKTFNVREDILSGDAGRERGALETLQKKYDDLLLRSKESNLSPDDQEDYNKIKLILTSMGEFLAKYLMALSDYARTKSFIVTLTGKTTEGRSGEFMKMAAEKFLSEHDFDVDLVSPADAEYGQATGMATLVKAMDNSQEKAKQGGVDFQITDDKMEIHRTGSGIQFDVPADVARFEDIQVFIPEITGSAPIRDLKQFIGLPANFFLGSGQPVQSTATAVENPALL